MTRADWYAQKHGGGWRTARRSHRCDCRPHGVAYCRREIIEGQRYFDTCQPNPYSKNPHVTLRFCEACANGEV